MHRVRHVHRDVSRRRPATGAEETGPGCVTLHGLPGVRGDLPGRRHRGDGVSAVHPIEAESYRIMAERVDLSSWPPQSRAVVARMIHASADLEYAETARMREDDVAAGVDAIAAGAAIVCDAQMVRVGVNGVNAVCFLDELTSAPDGRTRSSEAIRLAARRHRRGAVFVIGTAPSALHELLTLDVEPALVVGLPVGFVGAAESKQALLGSGLPCVTNVGVKGGSAVAAAAVNALIRLAREKHHA
jgi:precorrin isomerase